MSKRCNRLLTRHPRCRSTILPQVRRAKFTGGMKILWQGSQFRFALLTLIHCSVPHHTAKFFFFFKKKKKNLENLQYLSLMLCFKKIIETRPPILESSIYTVHRIMRLRPPPTRGNQTSCTVRVYRYMPSKRNWTQWPAGPSPNWDNVPQIGAGHFLRTNYIPIIRTSSPPLPLHLFFPLAPEIYEARAH
jgi:hypothetical protein